MLRHSRFSNEDYQTSPARREGTVSQRAGQRLLDENKARQVVDAVLAAKPRGYVGILSHFQRLVKLDIDRRSRARRERDRAGRRAAEQRQGRADEAVRRGLNFTFAQNPALIGGMRIKVGSDVYDGSIQSRLAQLAGSLTRFV